MTFSVKEGAIKGRISGIRQKSFFIQNFPFDTNKIIALFLKIDLSNNLEQHY